MQSKEMRMAQKVIDMAEAMVCNPLYRLAAPVNLEILDGESIAIVGRNGAGKSMLVDLLCGRWPARAAHMAYDFAPSRAHRVSDNIRYVAFRDAYGDADGNYYYQKRWNQHDVDDTPLVGELLDRAADMAATALCKDTTLTGDDRTSIMRERAALRAELLRVFRLDTLLDKRVIMLSSGELRKFQLTKALITAPRVLILDNPFIGLDAPTRSQLKELLRTLVGRLRLLVVLVLSKTDDIPDFITHVVPVEDMRVLPKQTAAAWKERQASPPAHVLTDEMRAAILSLGTRAPSTADSATDTDTVVAFNHVHIQYGDHTILNDLSLTVRRGEHWALSGENGAGKSTLLSIVCADNPQAYANHVVLFGHKRGSGESIWDIKRHIGYVSPEMHRAYQRDIPAAEIVASGLRDSIGLYHRPRPEQMAACHFWLRVFGIGHLADTSFMRLSSGEQRLALLARAFVKNPALLILDEPLHGLDLVNRRLVTDVIEAFCRQPDKTLIMVTHYEDDLPSVIDHRIHLQRHKL